MALPICCYHYLTAQEIVDAGFGLRVNFKNYSADSMRDLILQVAPKEGSYSKSVIKISKFLKSRKLPAERAADAIEEVFTYGWKHLRFPDEVYSLNFFQFYMIDIMFFLYSLLHLLSCLIIFILVICIRKCVKNCNIHLTGIKTKSD